jgi:hypothetical protein
MLIGDFTTYTELTARVTSGVDGFARTWRATPRMTIDYGLRISTPAAV